MNFFYNLPWCLSVENLFRLILNVVLNISLIDAQTLPDCKMQMSAPPNNMNINK